MNRAQPELHQRLMISSPLDEGERIEVRGFSQFRKAATKPSPNPLPCKGRRESIWCAFAVTREWSIKILGNRLFAIAAIIGVGLWFLGIPAISGGLGANPPEKLLHRTGEIAIWTLGAVLSLSPLRVLFPRSRLVNALNRHRRVIGMSACVYGLIHFGFHLLYEGDAQAIARSFSKLFIWLGLAGLSILVLLTATSNNFSIRKRNIARWLLFSLLALQIARVIRTLAARFCRKRLSHQSAVAVYVSKTAALGASASTPPP